MIPIRPENATLLAPWWLVRVSVPRAITRVHALALRSFLLSATQLPPLRRPGSRCEITIFTVAD